MSDFEVVTNQEISKLLEAPRDNALYAALNDLPEGHGVTVSKGDRANLENTIRLFPKKLFVVRSSQDGTKVVAVKNHVNTDTRSKIALFLKKGEATAGSIANRLRPLARESVLMVIEAMVAEGTIYRFSRPHRRNGSEVIKYRLV